MSAYDPKRTLMPPPVPIENALFHVTLAGAIAAGMFGGGGHGPDSTPTKAALSEIELMRPFLIGALCAT
jgi:hypothetical protein